MHNSVCYFFFRKPQNLLSSGYPSSLPSFPPNAQESNLPTHPNSKLRTNFFTVNHSNKNNGIFTYSIPVFHKSKWIFKDACVTEWSHRAV